MTKFEFISRFKNDLPGASAHEAFAPYRKHFENQANVTRKPAAVAIHFYIHLESWYFIIIERSSYDGKHSAQMAFPGGKPETNDPHLEFTARRESEEEIGIPTIQGELISELSMVWIPVSSFEVTPFVILHDERPTIQLNEREVANCFEVHLDELLDDSSVSKTTIQVNKEVQLEDIPCFLLNGKIVWGATALILAELKTLLKND